jgi:hypothetical protein
MSTYPHYTDSNGGRHTTHVPFRLSDDADPDGEFPQLFLFDPYLPEDDDR